MIARETHRPCSCPGRESAEGNREKYSGKLDTFSGKIETKTICRASNIADCSKMNGDVLRESQQ